MFCVFQVVRGQNNSATVVQQYSSTTQGYNNSTAAQQYKSTTVQHKDTTTVIQQYNKTKTKSTTAAHEYNSTTTVRQYNSTTTVRQYNSTTTVRQYNSTTTVRQYNSTTTVRHLIFVVPCIMLNSEIIPTRCNNCVYSSQWLYSTCFGRLLMMGGIVARNM